VTDQTTDPQRLARVALSRLGEPGDLRLARLVEELGAETVHDFLAGERDVGGMLTDVAKRLLGLSPERDLSWATKRGVRFVIPGDPEWPPGLDDLGHVEALNERGGVPLGLWVRGPLRLDQWAGGPGAATGVAVVGSRASTSYGADVAREIAATAAREQAVVVSGAAFGIDADAHLGALAGGGLTVAVLACGLDRAYPAAHADLLDRIAERGAVVSETPPGCMPTRIRFLRRNRLIAALAQGTVVVEAAVRSGALNTANWTERLGRQLMAVPGPVTSAASEGAHQLLRNGATLVSSGGDVLELIGRPGEHLQLERRAPRKARDLLTHRDQQILDAVPRIQAAGAASIARTAGIGLLHVQQALLRLEGKGLVRQAEEGWHLDDSALR
jgi:DNA processing protein